MTRTPSTPPAPPSPAARDYGAPVRSVKQVNALLQQTLAAHLPAFFCVAGEISNFRVYDRGHAFFTLKEPGAELPCVCWKETLGRIRFKPKDGMAVVARGPVKVYEPQGRLQLYIEALWPVGTGELELAYRQLCEKLRAEGLFAVERKRPIPRVPQHVVIMTSRTGDVLHDVLTTAYRRFPGLHAMLYPVPVQGETAAGAMVAGIEAVNAAGRLKGEGRREKGEIPEAFSPLTLHPSPIGPLDPLTPRPLDPFVDLILLVRGGGSLEDLWAFNDERLARAIVASRIPIATGIGHEPDTTIADLVSDLRGPTPTGVTELTIPDAAGLLREIDGHGAALSRTVRWAVDSARGDIGRRGLELSQAVRQRLRWEVGKIDGLCKMVEQIEPRHAIAQGWRRVEEAQRKLADTGRRRVQAGRSRAIALDFRLQRAAPVVRVARCQDHLANLAGKLRSAMAARLATARQAVAGHEKQLRAVSPQAVLERGYSITTNADGKLVRSKLDVRTGQVINTRVADGTIKSTVGTPKQGSLF